MQPNITASNASLTANIQQYLTAEDLSFINGLLAKHYFPISVWASCKSIQNSEFKIQNFESKQKTDI